MKIANDDDAEEGPPSAMMSKPSELTASLRTISQTIVEKYFRREFPYFDAIWDVIWKRLGTERIEDLLDGTLGVAGMGTEGIGLLGQDDRALDSMYVMAAMIGATINLLKIDKSTFLDTGIIDRAIRDEASRLGAPAKVRRILESYGTPLLAEHFVAVDRQPSSPVALVSAAPSRLWVEWCETKQGEPEVRFGAFGHDDLKTKSEFQMGRFELFVDETSRRILVYPDDKASSANLWTKLSARHSRLLYLTLHASRHTRVLAYDEIAKKALQDEFASANNVSRTKSELNDLLGGLLDQMLHSRRRMKHYEVELIPYCWIRYENVESALFGS